jgi:hypothetical protein
MVAGGDHTIPRVPQRGPTRVRKKILLLLSTERRCEKGRLCPWFYSGFPGVIFVRPMGGLIKAAPHCWGSLYIVLFLVPAIRATEKINQQVPLPPEKSNEGGFALTALSR